MAHLTRLIAMAVSTMVLLASVALAQAPVPPDPNLKPNPASEAAVRRMTAEATRGQPNYDLMTDELAATVRAQEVALQQMFQRLGPLKSIDFVGVAPAGIDVFDVHYANGDLRWAIRLTPEGKTATALLVHMRDDRPGAPSITARAVLPAADGIFQAFKTHDLVGLGDDHDLAQGMDFYAALVRDPRFAAEVRNVVVEFGAGARQDVIDRFVAGKVVPYTELRTIWTDTVGWIPNAGLLGFAKFLAAVRGTNATLPPDKRIRVWAGEPPMDWSSATSSDYRKAIGSRDSYAADVIARNILAKGEKALVIYGSVHFAGGAMLRGRVEATHPNALFVILPYTQNHRPEACNSLLNQVAKVWPAAALVTSVGAGPTDPVVNECATLDVRSSAVSFVLTRKGGESPPPTPNTPVASDPGAGGDAILVHGDAVVFYAPLAALAKGPWLPDYYLDAKYRLEMSRRSQIGGPPLRRFPADEVLRRSDYDFKLDAPGFAQRVDAMFKEFDRNQDGVVTADEYVDPIPQ